VYFTNVAMGRGLNIPMLRYTTSNGRIVNDAMKWIQYVEVSGGGII
jgi:hypothetical protein